MKKLKSLLLVFMFMFSAILLVGCGGNPLDSEVTVNKSGNFQTVSASSIQSEASEAKEITESDVTGYKFSISEEGQYGTNKTIAIVKFKDGKLSEAAMKINMNVKVEDETTTADIEGYFKEDCWYLSVDTKMGDVHRTFKTKFTTDQESLFEENEQYIESFTSTLDFLKVEELLGTCFPATTSLGAEKYAYEKAVDGETTKYRIVLNEAVAIDPFNSNVTLENFHTYFIIKDGYLNGFESNTSIKTKVGTLELNSTTKMGLTQYDDAISYPDFSDYQGIEAI